MIPLPQCLAEETPERFVRCWVDKVCALELHGGYCKRRARAQMRRPGSPTLHQVRGENLA